MYNRTVTIGIFISILYLIPLFIMACSSESKDAADNGTTPAGPTGGSGGTGTDAATNGAMDGGSSPDGGNETQRPRFEGGFPFFDVALQIECGIINDSQGIFELMGNFRC